VLIVSSLSRNAFTSQHLETLESICEFLGIAFLEAHKLENRLFLDDKFGVAYTPRYFAETLLPDAVRMSGETRRPLAGMFFDLDFFGKPNKVFGNDTIDKYVFGPFIRMIGRSLRQGTFFARHGGDEFSILFPDDNGDGAVATSERLRKLLEKRIFKLSKELGTDENAAQTEYRAILAGIDEHGAGQIIQDVRFGKNGDQYVVTATIRFTMSSGVAVYRSGNAAGEIGEGPDNFLSRMNTAYLAAKRLGRNQTYFIGQRLVASSPIAK
jgi:diguanylate cyclase (GGDEF)-like protein